MEIIYNPDQTVTIIGDNGEKQTVPNDKNLEAKIVELAGPATVPEAVSARQMKLALYATGKIDAIEGFVSSQDKAVQISWQSATEFRRDDPMLKAMALEFGMTDEQADDLFRLAASM